MATEENKFPQGSIVLVDGDPDAELSPIKTLADSGFEVIYCKDPTRSIRIFDTKKDNWKPTLFLVDVILPQLSGFELVRRLVDEHFERKVPILMMSKHMSSEDELEAHNAGAQGLVRKPVSLESLLQTLEKGKIHEMKQKIREIVISNGPTGE